MSYNTRTILQRPVDVAESTTVEVARFPVTSPCSLRVDIFTGKVAGTGSLQLQDQSSFGVWTDVKSVTLTASTDKTTTFDTDTNEATSTAHGFIQDQAVVFNTDDALPTPLQAGSIYFVELVDDDTFKVKAQPGSSLPIDLSDGSGTHTTTALAVYSITVQDTVTADQDFTPVRPTGRIQGVMSTSQTVQVCAIKVCEA